ncbi:MAG: riboflavin synthase [Deltaproteobacteria bacterium]|nr:MAG: riboflavin synthase [Deltaproteobacteria bacterium]
MFTGLVEGVGEITASSRQAEGLKLTVALPFPAAELVLGDSVAVAGACLTVVEITSRTAAFEVSPETLARTTLALKKAGDRVNLERALKLGDRLGGHLVTGHVDGKGLLKERREGADYFQLKIETPAALSRYVIEKGSIAIDGVSLTVNTCQGNAFTVNIIPHTARKTTLANLRTGDQINLESDIIGKYVEKLLGAKSESSGVTAELLARHGFL